MTGLRSTFTRYRGVLRRLARDRSGNVLAMIAASLFPLLALLGSGIDMSRGYLSYVQLQHACDSGVLAARKRLGTGAAASGTIPDDVAETGQRFFNLNFLDEDFGTANRTFAMTLEADYSISGAASVDVPTSIMQVFGFNNLPVSVDCTAQLNMSNTDIMMVLDTTGSMSSTNPGDSTSRLEALRSVVKGFYTQMSANVPATSRLRFGFVPYATNVNVGGLLDDAWIVDEWDYQSRQAISPLTTTKTRTYTRSWLYISGSTSENVTVDSYEATFDGANYTCPEPLPENTYAGAQTLLSESSLPFAGPPSGTQTIKKYQIVYNGTTHWNRLTGTTCEVRQSEYNDYTQTFEQVTEPYEEALISWLYKQHSFDVSDWRTDHEANGCIEERDTYEIDDYDNVDLTKALDLDIDLVPTSKDSTKWRPQYPYRIYARSYKYDGTGSLSTTPSTTTDEYQQPAYWNYAVCPPAAQKLQEMTSAEIDTYLASLTASGSTYHDIGMIWGGRLLSPTGIFASENADVSASTPTTRHLIYLTDGQTAPLSLSYSSYGLEPLDKRRWSESSTLTLTQTVEKRFAFACEEVKKKNITVWVISFGTYANYYMQECAGTDHYYVADDADQLEATFADIANRMAELRMTK